MSVNFYTNNGVGQYQPVKQDIQGVKSNVAKIDALDKSVEKALLSPLPMFRRTSSLEDKVNSGDFIPAAGLIGLTVMNFPEDCNDIKAAFKQLTQKGYKPSYDYTEFQNLFSFFRGTLLHNLINPDKTKHPKLAQKLLAADKTIFETKLGEKILNSLNVEIEDFVDTPREDIGSTKKNPIFVKALKFKGQGKFKAFGELTARAMTRTTLIGTAVLALLEVPKIFKVMGQGDTITEQAGNTAKQTVKSGINLASLTAGIAYGGAIGAKKFGATGSLIGMGVGATLGAFASNKLQSVFS